MDEITVDEIMAIFQEEQLPKGCCELLLERGSGFVETLINEIPFLTNEDNPRIEAEDLGGL